MAKMIRERRSSLPGIAPVEIEPNMREIYGELDGESLTINNEIFRCRGLRKLHLEMATLGGGLQILHCVFFPDPRFDLPIFGLDLVAGPIGISAAIVDLSPVRSEMPQALRKALENVDRPSFTQVRDLPAWGSIFSPYVTFIRPADRSEEKLFMSLVEDYLNVLNDALRSTNQDYLDSTLTIERCQGQISYCIQQKRNDKTRSVLAKAFSPEWADRYIEEVLFDFPQEC